MEKVKIQKIEQQKPEEFWSKLHDLESEEDLRNIFTEVMNKLGARPDLYYIETDQNDTRAVVRKRADNSIIYGTEVPREIKALKKAGVGKGRD